MSRVAQGFPDIPGEHRRWMILTAVLVVVAVGAFVMLQWLVHGLQIRRVQYIYGLFAGLFMMAVMAATSTSFTTVQSRSQATTK